MKLYLEVTRDELALPCKVCENVRELAEKTGLTPHTIYCKISAGKKGLIKYPRFISVKVPDDD